MINLVILLIFFLSITGIVVGYVNQVQKCPRPKVEYRYIPRSFQEEQDNPVPISQQFNDMFTQPSPWLLDFDQSQQVNRTGRFGNPVNRYYITG